jgi:predicted MPP superfamily phosphohydrolase
MLGFWLILTAIIVFNLGWWRWADRRLKPLRWALLWRSLLAIFIGAQLGYLLAFKVVPQWARRAHEVVPDFILGTVFLWGLLVLPITGLITLTITMGRGTIGVIRGRLHPQKASTLPTDTPSAELPALSRRQILAAAAVAVPPLVTGIGVAYGQKSLYDLQITHIDIPIAGLPDHLEGVKIAQVTDCHVGKFVHEKYLRKAAEMANSLNADIHLLTGDLIDLSIHDLPLALDFVSWLKPKHDLAMCEGNHDLLDDANIFYAETGRRGVPILANDSRMVRLPNRSTPINLMGLKWGVPETHEATDAGYAEMINAVWTKRDPLRLSVEQGGPLPILMAHHPHAFDAAAAAGVPLTLSGHTHGGLLMLSEKVGPAALMYRYYRGLYQKPGAALYVSNGVGSWFPVRTSARPEIACLTLRRA